MTTWTSSAVPAASVARATLGAVRISALRIINFRAVTSFELTGLRDAVVISGPNGCGKSCVLDAIRLLKSAYGGYQPNEFNSWLGEFQINLNQHPGELRRLLQDPGRDLEIAAEFSFASEEVQYLRANAGDLTMAAAWREIVPESERLRALSTASLALQARTHSAEVEQLAIRARGELETELSRGSVTARMRINQAGIAQREPSRLLEIAFTNEENRLGMLDFYSAQRYYNRESVANVNLDVSNAGQQRRAHALYNMQNKFNGLKSEMAGTYVRELLAERAGSTGEAEDLVAALKELFRTFFPGKEFLGPEPTTDGRVDFPVKLANGSVHDLDELSSGEKEVLYGYVRLRSSPTRNSVVLVDEPELHLNPRLVRGLARFYFNHLVTTNGHQLWLISHSDTLLREAVNLEEFDVYHMRQGDATAAQDNQALRITNTQEVERLVIDLVGDLAAYRPGAKVVFFEGSGDSGFDVRMVSRLFPDFDEAVNSISAGSKQQVTALHGLLDRIGREALGARFYAVRDRDSTKREEEATRVFTWDAYHIENYLLEAEYMYRAMMELSQADASLDSPEAVRIALERCARETIPALVHHELTVHTYDALHDALRVGGARTDVGIAEAIYPSIEGSLGRIDQLREGSMSLESLRVYEADVKACLEADLASGEWRSTFRGRDVLKRFVQRHVHGANYESFRDLVLARMREAAFRPTGMDAVLGSILADRFP